MAGWFDPIRRLLGWPSSPAGRTPVRVAVVRAAGNAPGPLRASPYLPAALRAGVNAAIHLRGSLSMSTATGFLQFHQGEAREYDFRVDGLPATAGWTVVFTVFGADGSATLTKSPALDTREGVAARGWIALTLSHAETAALGAGSYRFELRRTDSGSETMLCKGSVEVLDSLGW